MCPRRFQGSTIYEHFRAPLKNQTPDRNCQCGGTQIVIETDSKPSGCAFVDPAPGLTAERFVAVVASQASHRSATLENDPKTVYDVSRSSRNPRVSDLAGTPRPPFPANNWQFKGGITMPTSKEFAIRLDDRPGTLGKVCRTLADRRVNILPFQASPAEGKSLVRMVVDNPTTAKTVFDSEHLPATEVEVAQVKLPHRPGELARAAIKLGEANININYCYCGIEPGTNASLLIFGVAEASKAASILEQVGAKAKGT